MISFMPYRSKAPLDSARFSVNSQERSGEQSARRRGHSESLRESLTFEFPLQRFNDSTNHVARARHLSEMAALLPLHNSSLILSRSFILLPKSTASRKMEYNPRDDVDCD